MSEALWRSLAEKALGGQSLDTLANTTIEGLRIAPLHPRSQTDRLPLLRSGTGRWTVAQRVDHPDTENANRIALLDLEGGADALTLVFPGDTARGFGLPLESSALKVSLDRVELDLIALRLDAGTHTPEAAKLLTDLVTTRRLASAGLDVDLGFDPIGAAARTGDLSHGNAADGLKLMLDLARHAGLGGHVLLADGRPYHEAGAGEAEELAAVLATAVTYLRRFEQVGLSVTEAAAQIAFLLVADADIFVSIAKFRALRRLWARVEAACGVTPTPIKIHAETAWRMMTRRDPWSNVMRATAAVFAAGVGGADAITVLPFTLASGLPDDDARRLARTTQLILLEEAHLAKVDDPAAGSGGIETLTDELCTRAWSLFQDVEREGGIEASLAAGALQARLAGTAAKRSLAIATAEHGIIGTTVFPSLEPIAAQALVEPAPRPPHRASALPCSRDAEPFEVLRERIESIEARTGSTPTVFLATLGTLGEYGPTAAYVANVFAAAGVATTRGPVEAFDAATTPIACICAATTVADDALRDAARRLTERGARQVFVGGLSTSAETGSWAKVIHPGCHLLQVLSGVATLLAGGDDAV